MAHHIKCNGAKWTDDVLAVRVWEANPGLIKFETIGIHLSKKRKDTEVLI